MSSFRGLFEPLPGVSCDRFDGENLSSDQFFLSHCHSDHMHGLEALVPVLCSKNTVKVNHRIYCSSLSKHFLVRRHPRLDGRYVRELDPGGRPEVVRVFDKLGGRFYRVRVTAVGANHCAGSVMFLFERLGEEDGGGGGERVDRRYLYTGDFRFDGSQAWSDREWAERLRALHDASGSPLSIDEMYLDTTFCSDDYPSFPSRQEAINRIWDIVQDWVRKNGLYKKQRDKGKHVVLFTLPAQYGHESILKSIFEKSGLKWRVHVSHNRFADYMCSDELGDCTESDPRDERAQWIHACSWKDAKESGLRGGCSWADSKVLSKEDSIGGPALLNRNKTLPCQSGAFEVCHIRPTAMYFSKSRMQNLADKVVRCKGSQFFRVCFSCHSSLGELRAFVKHFMPARLIPCVIPTMYKSAAEVQIHFKDILPQGSFDPKDTLGSLGSLTPCKSSDGETAPARDTFWDSSPETIASRKRKLPCPVDFGSCSQATKRSLFDNSVSVSPCGELPLSNSSDEDDILSGLNHASSKRKKFHRSKSAFAHASLPVTTGNNLSTGDHLAAGAAGGKSRRASLPYNLKIPAITITPSSPSPDPNHPDYPEFFEDKLYIESKNMSTSSTEDSKSGGNNNSSKEVMELDHSDTFSLRLSHDNVSVDMEERKEDESVGCEASSSHNAFSCPESMSMSSSCVTTHDESHEVIELSSGGVADSASYDDMESTPDLDEVFKQANSEDERRNCENYSKAMERRQNQGH